MALNLETAILLWLFSAAVAAAIAHTKNRDVGEGFLWGALFGVIGVIIVLCLPPPKSKIPLPPGTPPPPGAAKRGWYPDQRAQPSRDIGPARNGVTCHPATSAHSTTNVKPSALGDSTPTTPP